MKNTGIMVAHAIHKVQHWFPKNNDDLQSEKFTNKGIQNILINLIL
jgi:hypothetical protein